MNPKVETGWTGEAAEGARERLFVIIYSCQRWRPDGRQAPDFDDGEAAENGEIREDTHRDSDFPPYRLAFVIGLRNGTLPATFVIPASTGDALTAVTAPIVAFAMGRGGMRTWALALVWNALGLADLLNAVSLGSLTGSTANIVANYSFVFVGVTAAVLFHIAATALLVRKTTMDYWAQ